MQQITKLCADSLRSFAQYNFGIELKSSHAHELVAAYFGYSSRAALLADTRFPITDLGKAEFIVLTPTAKIKERRSNLKGLPLNLPENLAEGVYLPLYKNNLVSQPILPTFEELGKTLADKHWASKPVYYQDLKIQRQGVQLEFNNDHVAIVVFREYFSPALLLSFQQGKKGVVYVFILNRVAASIGFAKTDHISAEAETLEAAIDKMRDIYHGIINTPRITNAGKQHGEILPTFPEWLIKQKNRNSPLGDLARKREFNDRDDNLWPLFNNLEDYRDYLTGQHPPRGAVSALQKAWKSYHNYIQKKNLPTLKKPVKSSTKKTYDGRKIVFVKNVEPVHYSKRTIENFDPGDKAWVSWDGRKAIPITILETDEMYYTFRIERPLKNAGDEHYVRLDEVGSTPELACKNHFTL
ncbi:hypothetical protein [Sphingobacterium sp. HSC-15S19]|uniref:hypothetical protein n=1 Tax=Sphingobacterium TaxID=28453 RepID=UPI003D1DBE02